MDFDKIAEGARVLIEGICGTPLEGELADSPHRIADMWRKFFDLKSISDKEIFGKSFLAQDYKNFVIVRNIQFSSFCEHHLLPFFGDVSVAYIPKNGTIIGLSKLARIIDKHSKALQLQERLTQEILNAIASNTQNEGALVIIRAQHMCMTTRGVMKPSSETITRAVSGKFSSEQDLVIEAQQLIFGKNE